MGTLGASGSGLTTFFWKGPYAACITTLKKCHMSCMLERYILQIPLD